MRGSMISNIIALIGYLRKNNFSSIIAHQLLSAFLLMPYSIIFQKPFVLVLHDNPFLFTNRDSIRKMSILKRFSALFIDLFSNIAILASNSTVCISVQIKDAVEKHLNVRNALSLAEYGIDAFPEVSVKDRNYL